jgi:hypothetical protein
VKGATGIKLLKVGLNGKSCENGDKVWGFKTDIMNLFGAFALITTATCLFRGGYEHKTQDTVINF